ncbi:hypothetical protein G7Z17_g1773 [Cylindrodendrum hubeiense]|uniref:NACHT domain-containing protein n=1 Tax=Cylindrodendrum hubeiense TaxID=595255 RepID=A0A9P5LJR9_9HYPO|nr:hypothetical protein G7Z17_g1773 [Cylindrodendrum hubeiense]
MNTDDEFELLDYEDAALPERELATVQAWLKPTSYDDPSSEYRRHLAARVDQTGVWLRGTKKYQQWQKSDDHGFIWVKGAPGAGKSVLSAAVIGDLQTEEPHAHVLFFFFRQIVESNRYPANLIRDWLAQLLPFSIALQGRLHALAKHRLLADVSDEELWEALLAGLQKVKLAYCIVDAMDEMDLANIDFLRRLNELALFRPGNVKVLMTSRPRPDLQSYLAAPSVVHVNLHEEEVGREVQLFVSNRLERMELDQGLQSTLTQDITSRSRGLFLYAEILCNEVQLALQNGQTPDLSGLPPDILDMVRKSP